MNRIAAVTLAAFACISLQPIPAPAQPQAAAAPTHVDWNFTPAQINASCAAGISKAQQRVKALLADKGAKTFSSVVLPLENLTSDLNDETLPDWFAFEVSTSKDVRDASLKCNNDESAFLTSLGASPQLYQAVAKAKRSTTARDVYQRKL